MSKKTSRPKRNSKSYAKAAEKLEKAAKHFKKAAKLEKKGHLTKAARQVDAAESKTADAERHITEADSESGHDVQREYADGV
jgi:hypothetical protein